MKAAISTFAIALSLFAACAEPYESAPTGEPVALEEAALGHCRTICPKCRPHQICPRYMCIQECTYPQGYCESDADCVTAADYCHGGCDCNAASVYDNASSSCPDQVYCFADACLNQTARCDVKARQCVLN